MVLTRRNRWTRRFLRVFGWLFTRFLTRMVVRGREHFETTGPVIFAANHTSSFDALLFMLLLPTDTVFVGPGDFKLLWPANLVIERVGLIPMKRGAVDRAGLKQMLAVLNGGGRLAMFPEGGTWEKPIHDVKSGISYLSQSSGARIVPMGFSGTYQIWGKLARLQRPRITIHLGPPLPAVEVGTDRAARQEQLEAGAVALMDTIYNLLERDTQAHYDRMGRLVYRGTLVSDLPVSQTRVMSYDALAELVSKPNLFSPLFRNARLPVKPFVHTGRYFSAGEMRRAADALQAAFAEGDYASYLEYRLGEEKAAKVRASLQMISEVAAQLDAAQGRMAFSPTVIDSALDPVVPDQA